MQDSQEEKNAEAVVDVGALDSLIESMVTSSQDTAKLLQTTETELSAAHAKNESLQATLDQEIVETVDRVEEEGVVLLAEMDQLEKGEEAE